MAPLGWTALALVGCLFALQTSSIIVAIGVATLALAAVVIGGFMLWADTMGRPPGISPAMTTTARRWSYSLRTLFVVVTVLACGLGAVLSQRPVFLLEEVRFDGEFKYTLEFPNPRFWGMALSEAALAIWLVVLRRRKTRSADDSGSSNP